MVTFANMNSRADHVMYHMSPNPSPQQSINSLNDTMLPTGRLAAMANKLVELPEVERLSSLVIRILGGNPGKVGFCRWIISCAL